jgi:membrane associated rhomboid family serine protease
MMFLALAGRPDAVRVLLEPRRARHMSKGARTYWVAVAHQNHGDREAAAAAYERARGKARGRPRELIDEALAKLAEFQPSALSPETTEVVAQIEASPLPGPIRFAHSQAPWATWTLTLAVLGVAGVIALLIGPSSDLGVLLRAGAMVRSRIDEGEWWRLISCVFVHAGALHLAVNAIALFFLGRIAEELFGSTRTFAIFGGAGIAGSVASYLAAPVGISAGASGAILGILGAIFIEVTVHRERYRMAWKRGMWGGLLVVTIAQVAVGFLYPVIDQWAHGAGLVGGVAFGALVSPNARWPRLARHAARGFAIAFGGLSIAVAVLVARTSITDSLDGPKVRHELGDIAVTAPASWIAKGDLHDPDRLVIVVFGHATFADLPAQIAEWVVKGQENVSGFQQAPVAPDRVVVLPAGWEGTELLATVDDPMGNTQRHRLVAAGKRFGDRLILIWLYAPETIMRAAPEFFTQLVASVGPF